MLHRSSPRPAVRSRCSRSDSRFNGKTHRARFRRARFLPSTLPRTRTLSVSETRRSPTLASSCVHQISLHHLRLRVGYFAMLADRQLTRFCRTLPRRSTRRRASAPFTRPGSSLCSRPCRQPLCETPALPSGNVQPAFRIPHERIFASPVTLLAAHRNPQHTSTVCILALPPSSVMLSFSCMSTLPCWSFDQESRHMAYK